MPSPLLRRRAALHRYPLLAAQFVAASTQYAAIADAAQVGLNPGTGDFSLDLWVRTNTTGTTRYICSKGAVANNATNAPGWGVVINSTNSISLLYADTGASSRSALTTVATLAVSDWTHVVINADRDGDITIYFDGVNIRNGAMALTGLTIAGAAPFALGAGSANSGAFLSPHDGRLDAVRFRSRVLSAGEIARAYNNSIGLAYRDLTAEEKVGLVAAWGLDGHFADSHGPNHLAPVNNPTFAPGKR